MNTALQPRVPVSNNGAVEHLARSIEYRHPGMRFAELPASERRAFTNFCYSEMTDQEKMSWFLDAMVGREQGLIEILRRQQPDLEAAGRVLLDGYLYSVAYIFDRCVYGR